MGWKGRAWIQDAGRNRYIHSLSLWWYAIKRMRICIVKSWDRRIGSAKYQAAENRNCLGLLVDRRVWKCEWWDIPTYALSLIRKPTGMKNLQNRIHILSGVKGFGRLTEKADCSRRRLSGTCMPDENIHTRDGWWYLLLSHRLFISHTYTHVTMTVNISIVKNFGWHFFVSFFLLLIQGLVGHLRWQIFVRDKIDLKFEYMYGNEGKEAAAGIRLACVRHYLMYRSMLVQKVLWRERGWGRWEGGCREKNWCHGNRVFRANTVRIRRVHTRFC